MHTLILFVVCLTALVVVGIVDQGPVPPSDIAVSEAPDDPRMPTPLTALDTADDVRGWEAVGRLDLGDGGFCTGALIDVDLVLTAAHCVEDPDGPGLISTDAVRFLAGYRNGRAAAYRGARRLAVHPEYRAGDDLATVAHDIALIQLDRPIRSRTITPFPVGAQPRTGAEVGIVSYAKGRALRPSLQEVCGVLARRRGSLVMSCDVDFGASGAPVFSLADGEPRIVSVVSAKGRASGRKVSYGTRLDAPLDALIAEVVATPGGAMRAATDVAPGDAKFLRP